MLKQRMITAVILAPLLIFILFSGQFYLLTGLLGLVLAMCAWEWAKLIPLENIAARMLFLVLLASSLWLCANIYNIWIVLCAATWGINILMILSFPASQNYWGNKPVVAVWGLIILPLFSASLIRLYQLPQGLQLLLSLLFIIWAADIGAYFSGKLMGKHKLIPQVSPGKSWEGVVGGLISALLVGVAVYHWLALQQLMLWMVTVVVIVIISIFGDLFISILKRRLNVKDTGAILPGHGGLLDRLDSLIAALPFYYWSVNLLTGV